ncbi:PQQ-binding-like beta-propeller repeat protein [Pirellulales bacterium]|nr:PQQ-binding-like beta-propeller repeat protein [Pirellulales bacterium]
MDSVPAGTPPRARGACDDATHWFPREQPIFHFADQNRPPPAASAAPNAIWGLPAYAFAGVLACGGLATGLFGGWAGIAATAAEVKPAAPVAPAAPTAVAEEHLDGVWLPSERDMVRGIDKAKRSIEAGNYAQPLRFLDQILRKPEDSWLTDDAGRVRGLKDTVRKVIGELPPEGQEAYEAAFGPTAERLVQTAIASGDDEGLVAAADRYFYTAAGMEAALLLAQREADAGRFFSAALIYDQLLNSPSAVRRFGASLSVRSALAWAASDEWDTASETLRAAVNDNRRDQIRMAGRVRRLPATDDAVDWLEPLVAIPRTDDRRGPGAWLTFRGGAARNARSAGGLPHMRIRWDQQLLDYGRLEQLFDEFRDEYLRQGSLAPVANAPLAIGDVVIVRTPHNLLAVDFRTGKRIWETPRRRVNALENLIRRQSTGDDDSDPGPARAFARRIWEDYLYGVVSSDGERILVVRDLPMPDADANDQWNMLRGRGVDPRSLYNRLSAYELKSDGRLAWEVDGADAAELRGAFFLGAPLAVGGTLYALAEIRGSAVELVALDAASGSLQWRQQLAHLEHGVTVDRARRLQASMPSYHAGMLVCPTGAGVVVGIQLSKRSLRWAYRYERAVKPASERGHRNVPKHKTDGKWTDAAAIIVDGRVLLTPPESDALHCLDLQTGDLLWKQPRGKWNRLASVADGRVILAGPKGVGALHLADGKPAWSNPLEFGRGVSPSGTGFVADGRYVLPLSSAEVVAIDLADGHVVGRTAARHGQVLGNLICHRGSVISQSGRFLECFDQRDVLRAQAERALADNPHDVAALRTLGEIAFHAGRLSDAIAMLEQAYNQSSEDYRTRDVLAECLITALDEDFVAYREKLDLLRRLEDAAPKRQIALRRIEAEGFAAAGLPETAGEACLAIYELASDASAMIEMGDGREASAARWVYAQLDAILSDCDADERTRILDRITALQPNDDNPNDDDPNNDDPNNDDPHNDDPNNQAAWDHYLAYFGKLPGADAARRTRARRLSSTGQQLAAQQAWLDLAESSELAVRAEAVARIAEGLHLAGRHRAALAYDRQLAGPLADVPCLDGQTGSECLAGWSQTAESETDWPTGRVEAAALPATATTGTRSPRFPIWEIRLERTDPVLGSGNVMISAGHRNLEVRDSFGIKQFEASLDQEQLGHVHSSKAGRLYGVSRGNLLVVSLGRQLAAFDTLASSGVLRPDVLWRANLAGSFASQSAMPDQPNASDFRPGSSRAARTSYGGQWLGVIGPLTADSCVFQDQRQLHCVAPLTGVAHWSRNDVPPGCDLFGDERVTLATPKGETRAFVFSTVDGRSLGEVDVPPWRERLVTRGRVILRWSKRRTPRGGHELSAVDPFAGETLWRRTYAQDARIDVAEGRFIAVVEQSGRAEIVDGDDGRVVVEYQMPEIPDQRGLREIHLAVGSDSLTLTTDRPAPAERRATPVTPLDFSVVDGQVMVFDRATGEARWIRPAEVKQQGVMIAQPADLPVLVFASVYPRRNAGGRRDNIRLLVLDKASGRTLYRSDLLPPSGGSHCVARVVDSERRIAAVEMTSRQIQIRFSDLPRPPAPPALAEVEAADGARSGGLGRIFGKYRSIE